MAAAMRQEPKLWLSQQQALNYFGSVWSLE
jgi:hypothetical protein